MLIEKGGRTKEYQDGGGFGSRGRLDPRDRLPPKLAQYGADVLAEMDNSDIVPQVRRLCASGQILRLQKANLPDHTGPFPNQLVDNIRRRWFNRLDPRGTTDLSRVAPG